jgi:hypothetical protein
MRFKEMSEGDISSLKISTFKIFTFQKPVSGIQEFRNLHNIGCSADILQACRSSFFTNYDIM